MTGAAAGRRLAPDQLLGGLHGAVAHGPQGLGDRDQGWPGHPGQRDGVETDDREVLGNPPALLVGHGHGGHGHLVAGREHRGQVGPALQQPAHGDQPAVVPEVAVLDGPVVRRDPGGVAGSHESSYAGDAGHRIVGAAGDHPDPSVPGRDQRRGGIGGRLLPVDGDHRHAWVRGAAGHDHVRQREGPQQLVLRLGESRRHHHGGVDLATGQQPGVVLQAGRTGPGRADDDGVAQLVRRVLDPVEHLAREGVRHHRLQQPDRHAALGDEHPGERVGGVAEPLGRLPHRPGRRAGAAPVVQHPGDGRDGDAGRFGDVLDRGA